MSLGNGFRRAVAAFERICATGAEAELLIIATELAAQLGRTGSPPDVTEALASERGFDVLTGTFEGIDKHPGTLPNTHKQLVKLIAARESGVILGGEIIGGESTGELTNMIGLMIQNRMTVCSLLTFQIGTHPFLTAAPTTYPLIKAAEDVAKQRCAFNREDRAD